MIVYFSGTGNSRYVAQMTAHLLKDSIFNARTSIRQGENPTLSSQLPWVFAAPTYAWRLPRIFEDFIRNAEFKGSRDAYFIMTCGHDAGNAAKYVKQLCSEKKLNYRGLLPAVMPENYVAMFPVPDKSRAAKITARAEPVISMGAELIAAGKDFPEAFCGPLDIFKSTVINPAFYKFIVKDKKFYTKDSCTGCGKCAAVCPLHNIKLADGRPQWLGNCTHCMSCICGCPEEAIEYGWISHGKPRYQCEDYK